MNTNETAKKMGSWFELANLIDRCIKRYMKTHSFLTPTLTIHEIRYALRYVLQSPDYDEKRQEKKQEGVS